MQEIKPGPTTTVGQDLKGHHHSPNETETEFECQQCRFLANNSQA